jgi:hypothetical protein
MKDKKIKKDFDSVEFFRDVKEKMSKHLIGKSFKEQKEILRKIRSGEIRSYNDQSELQVDFVRDKKDIDRHL